MPTTPKSPATVIPTESKKKGAPQIPELSDDDKGYKLQPRPSKKK